MKILSEKYIPESEVYKLLSKRAKETEELEYEFAHALDHAKLFAKSTKADAELLKNLIENYSIPEREAVKLVDVKPKTKELLNLILSKQNLDDSQLDEILKLFG